MGGNIFPIPAVRIHTKKRFAVFPVSTEDCEYTCALRDIFCIGHALRNLMKIYIFLKLVIIGLLKVKFKKCLME